MFLKFVFPYNIQYSLEMNPTTYETSRTVGIPSPYKGLKISTAWKIPFCSIGVWMDNIGHVRPSSAFIACLFTQMPNQQNFGVAAR